MERAAGGVRMTVSAISRYRGGSIEEVLPLARALKAIYRGYGVGYRLSRFETGADAGDWLVVVTYADAAALERAEGVFAGGRICSGCLWRFRGLRRG